MKSTMHIKPGRRLISGHITKYGIPPSWMNEHSKIKINFSVYGDSVFDGLIYQAGVSLVRFPQLFGFMSPFHLSSIGICFRNITPNVVMMYGYDYYKGDLQLIEIAKVMYNDLVEIELDWSGSTINIDFNNVTSGQYVTRVVNNRIPNSNIKWYIKPHRATYDDKLVTLVFYSSI